MYLSLAFLLAIPALVRSSCFAPNGIEETNTAYQPCISVDGIHSTCCALNRALVGGTADVCMQNGLCRSPTDGSYWRGFCSDKNWDSPGCLPRNICDSNNGGTSSNSNELTKCEDGTWCCGGGNTTCCDNKQGFKLNPTRIALALSQPSPTASSSTSTLPTLTTSTQSSTTTPAPATSTQFTSPNVAAIVVGIALPLTLFAILCSIASFYLGKRSGRKSSQSPGDDHGSTEKELSDEESDVSPASSLHKPFDGIMVSRERSLPALPRPNRPSELCGAQPGPVELGTGRRESTQRFSF